MILPTPKMQLSARLLSFIWVKFRSCLCGSSGISFWWCLRITLKEDGGPRLVILSARRMVPLPKELVLIDPTARSAQPTPKKKNADIRWEDEILLFSPEQSLCWCLWEEREKAKSCRRHIYIIHIPKQINTLRTLGNTKFSSLHYSWLADPLQIYLNAIINNITF